MPAIPPNPTRWCKQCSYPLNGVLDNSCPECGKFFDSQNPATFSIDPAGEKLRKIRPWIAVLLVAIVICFYVVVHYRPDLKGHICLISVGGSFMGAFTFYTFFFVRRQFQKRK